MRERLRSYLGKCYMTSVAVPSNPLIGLNQGVDYIRTVRSPDRQIIWAWSDAVRSILRTVDDLTGRGGKTTLIPPVRTNITAQSSAVIPAATVPPPQLPTAEGVEELLSVLQKSIEQSREARALGTTS